MLMNTLAKTRSLMTRPLRNYERRIDHRGGNNWFARHTARYICNARYEIRGWKKKKKKKVLRWEKSRPEGDERKHECGEVGERRKNEGDDNLMVNSMHTRTGSSVDCEKFYSLRSNPGRKVFPIIILKILILDPKNWNTHLSKEWVNKIILVIS